MRSDILNKLRGEIGRRAEAQKAQAECEANMLCLCAEILLEAQAGAVEIEKTQAQGVSTPEPYLTIEQVAQILEEKVDTIYAKVGRGQIPHHKLDSGRKADLRFRYSEIVAWSKANADTIQEQKRSSWRKLRIAS